jgi:GTP-binding protein YchF
MSSLSVGIVGLPNVGKSTLFNALTASQQAEAANYPFCTIEPNIGTVPVHDPRLEVLAKISKTQKIICPLIRFVDIAGLVKGASQGEGLGNAFLGNIRSVDAIAHVVRLHDDPNVVHVHGQVDPIADVEIINLELILSDLQMAEQALTRLERQAKSGNEEARATYAVLQRVQAHLQNNQPVRTLSLTPEESRRLHNYPFLTAKPVIYVANMGEGITTSQSLTRLQAYAAAEGSQVVPLCASLEAQIVQLPAEERREMLEALGLPESGLDSFIRAAYALLGLISFLTTGEQETRGWTITRGSTAYEAAGKIHGDIQKNFVRAQVISYDDFVHYNGRVKAREAGKERSEGKEYVMKDGDVVLFLHH